MKKFFKHVLASTVGVFIGLGIFTIIGMIIVGAMVAGMSSGKEEYVLKEKTILKLDLSGAITEIKQDNPFGSLFGGSTVTTIDDILDAVKKAKENDNIKGIYIKGGDMSTGIASLEPIRKALVDFKASDKFIFAYGDSYSQGAYYLASVADEVALNPQGTLDFSGLGSTIQFQRGMFEKLGVKMQVFKVGTFKSAVEPYIQDKMSDANREQTESFLGDIWGHWLKNISESRNISVEKLNEYADEFLAFSETKTLVDYKMVDTLMYVTQVEEYLKTKVEIEKDKKLKLASVANLNSVPEAVKNESKNTIAVLYADGAIMGDEMSGPSFLAGSVITAKQYVGELMKLKDDEKVKAVVFRVNSPGGSAYASEQIWNAVEEVKKVKPVIVSMGTYAASGGYYISAGANTIVAEPTTITGSIGIFGLIPDGTELAKMMGVTFDGVQTNKHGNFGGRTFGIPFLLSAQSRGFNVEESAMLQKYIERGYETFLTRCAEGRSKTNAEIDAVGQGRVWTGKQALELGLVDKLGGLEDAIKIAAETAKLEDYKTAKYPVQKDFMTQLLEKSMGETSASIAKAWMGEEAYNQTRMMQDLQNMDVMMAVMPHRVSY